MKKTTLFLLARLAKMSGDKKIRIALNYSKTVRQVRQAGIAAAQKTHGN